MDELIKNPIDSFSKYLPKRSPLLKGMEEKARKNEIPIVGPFVGHFLAFLTTISKAQKVLELGTATGYSAIWMGNVLKNVIGHLISIEENADSAKIARENIKKAGLSNTVSIKTGKAQPILKELNMKFDMIFMDVDKEYYQPLLPFCEKSLHRGGLLVADNTAFRDAQPFNNAIYDSNNWDSINIYGLWPMHNPDMDGICLARRI